MLQDSEYFKEGLKEGLKTSSKSNKQIDNPYPKFTVSHFEFECGYIVGMGKRKYGHSEAFDWLECRIKNIGEGEKNIAPTDEKPKCFWFFVGIYLLNLITIFMLLGIIIKS